MTPTAHQYVVRTLTALRKADWMATRQQLLDACRNGDDTLTLQVATHARECLTKNGFAI